MLPPLLKDIRTDLRKYFHLESDTLWRGKDLLIVVGQNGAGKSMLRRMFKQGAKPRKIAVYDFSQERRSMGGITSALIYGSEEWESTGYISIKTFQTSFKQKYDSDALLIWDEPEIGLSDESLLGVVQLVRGALDEGKDAHLLGCIFMTHSRLFVSKLLDYPRLAFIDLDGKYSTAAEWVDRKVEAADLAKVTERGHKRFRELTKLLKKEQGV